MTLAALEHVDRSSSRIVSRLRRLVAIPTVNPPGERYGEMVASLEESCAGLGMETRVHQVPAKVAEAAGVAPDYPRYNLIARWHVGAPRTVHFNAHYDVVPAAGKWKFPPFQPQAENGWMYGRGSGDMKGSIVALLTAIDCLRRSGSQPAFNIECSFTADEETGGELGVGYIVRQGLVDAESAVVCEGAAGTRVGLGHNGVLWLYVHLRGKPAHASSPDQGRNAFEAMLAVARHLQRYKKDLTTADRRYRDFNGKDRHPTLNIGGVFGGYRPEGQYGSRRCNFQHRSAGSSQRAPRAGGTGAAFQHCRGGRRHSRRSAAGSRRRCGLNPAWWMPLTNFRSSSPAPSRRCAAAARDFASPQDSQTSIISSRKPAFPASGTASTGGAPTVRTSASACGMSPALQRPTPTSCLREGEARVDLLKEFLRAAYDHFGGLVCINILWSLLSIPWLAAATAAALYGVALQGDWAPHARMLVIVLATEFVWFAPPTVLLFLAARQWLDGGSVSFRSLARQLPRHALRAQSAGMAIMATTCLLAINLVFYHHLGGWLGAVLSGLMGWVLLGLVLVSLYLVPVLLAGELGFRGACRSSLFLVIAYPGRTLVLLVFVAGLLALGLASGIGLLCGVSAAIALIESAWVRRLAREGEGGSSDSRNRNEN